MLQQLPLILQLDIAGNPQRWITYEDSAYYVAKDLVGWSLGEVDITLHGGISRLTGQQSTLTMKTIIAIKSKINPRQFRTNRVPLTNKTLFRRDQNVCAYCGDSFGITHLTRDHIHPQSKGGDNTWTNVVTACEICNKKKGDKSLEDSNMRLIYVPYVPNRNEYLILQNRKILTDQMKFLLTGVSKESRLLN